MRSAFLTSFYLCLLLAYSKGASLKSSASCIVDSCSSSSGQGGSCSLSSLCYSFQTSKNQTVCAPAANCSLFDACSSTKTCASNNSVCVINSCCLTPICMPTAMTAVCSSISNATTNSTNSGTTTIDAICPAATWNDIDQIAVNLTNIFLNNNYASTYDFWLDGKNNYIVPDSNNRRVLKYQANDTSTYTTIGAPNTTIPYIPNRVFVDSNGTVYSAEFGTGNGIYGYASYFRVVQYVEGNGTDGTVVFGDVLCGNQMNQLCQCGSLFVDRQGFIYCSDTYNHRVVKITPFTTMLTVVAGTNGVAGSNLDQLNTPAGIYIDNNNTLYVADTNNG
ncbi:unnamed protein product [Adineta steineri]|nr:unnamed protein product [Adineta steineri]